MKLTIFALCLLSQAAFCQNEIQWSHNTSGLVTAFVENRGQVTDQYNKANPSVQYIYANGLFNLQLKWDGFSYELFQLKQKQNPANTTSNFEYNADRPVTMEENQYEFHSRRIDVKFNGSSTTALIPANSTGTLQNFYTSNTGENGIVGVQSFYSVTYKNVYPGIDLIFSAPDEENKFLKYEWKVSPGADASVISMEYFGATALNPLEEGSIDVITSAGKINESKIVAYTMEDNLAADVQYAVHENVIGYRNAKKSSKTLIIDPNITWFSYYGGTFDEDLFEGEMSVDGKGNALLAGNTSSPQYIASTGAHQVIYGDGGVDGFAAKFKPNGKLAWATYYGSTSRDGCHAIAADASYNVFVAGNTFSSTGIATPGSHQPVLGGSMDAFLAKFNSDGIRQWATYYGGTGFGDQISAISCDGSGNVYFTGYTCSANNISTPGAYQEIFNGVDDVTGDVMVVKFTNSGTRVWGSYHSGPGQDRSHDLVLTGDGEFYVEGTCESLTQFATPGVHQSTYGGGPQDGFISKWDTSGHLQWCSYYGGEKEEHGRGLAIDSEGNAYIGGWTNSVTGIGTPGASQPNWAEGYNEMGVPAADGYLAKFTPDGLLDWGTYFGGEALERSRGIAIDKDHDFIYLVGQAGSKSLATSNIFQADTGLISGEGFVAKYLPDGTRMWVYFVGGIGAQTIFDADLDKFNSLYLFMTTDKTIFTSAKVHQTASNGDDEVMLVKLNPADTCFDKYEPNNSNLTAKKINTSSDTLFYGYTGVITEANDDDWLYIKTSAITNLKIKLSDLIADYDLYLYKNNGQLISSSTNIGDINETVIFNNAPQGKYLLKIVSAGSSFEPNACYRINAFTNSSPWVFKAEEQNMIANPLDMQVHLYPTPSTDMVHLKISSPESTTLHANIFSVAQQVMWSDEYHIQQGTQTLSMNVKELPPGMYFLHLEEDGKSMILKIVVQR